MKVYVLIHWDEGLEGVFVSRQAALDYLQREYPLYNTDRYTVHEEEVRE